MVQKIGITPVYGDIHTWLHRYLQENEICPLYSQNKLYQIDMGGLFSSEWFMVDYRDQNLMNQPLVWTGAPYPHIQW